MFLFGILESGGTGILIAAAFFLVALASGFLTFVMLRKTIKMAIRMAVVAVILLVAVFGSIALYIFLKPSPDINRQNNRPSSSSANQKR